MVAGVVRLLRRTAELVWVAIDTDAYRPPRRATSQPRVRGWRALARTQPPGGLATPGRWRRQAMCSRHHPLWTTADVAAFVMYDSTAARQLLQIAARRVAVLAPMCGKSVSERKMIMERLLSVAEAADLLGTTARFPRRLIAERRIRFVRLGRHIRIPESAIEEFIAACTVQPITWADVS